MVILIFCVHEIFADDGHHNVGETNAVSNVTNVTNINTINEYQNDLSTTYHAGLAQLLAGDAVACSTSTRKNQVGIGFGYSEGINGAAVGGCKTYVLDNGIPMMVGVKAMAAAHAKPSYNVGFNWTFD